MVPLPTRQETRDCSLTTGRLEGRNERSAKDEWKSAAKKGAEKWGKGNGKWEMGNGKTGR